MLSIYAFLIFFEKNIRKVSRFFLFFSSNIKKE